MYTKNTRTQTHTYAYSKQPAKPTVKSHKNKVLPHKSSTYTQKIHAHKLTHTHTPNNKLNPQWKVIKTNHKQTHENAKYTHTNPHIRIQQTTS